MMTATSKGLIAKLKENGWTTDLRRQKVETPYGGYMVWVASIYRKRKSFTGYGSTPANAVVSAALEAIRILA